MTIKNLKKSTKYVSTAILATMILVAFSAAPALATTATVPPYSTASYFHGINCSNNYRTSATPSSGNAYVYAQSTPSTGCGQASVSLVSSAIYLSSGRTMTLSNPSATVTGTLYVDPVGGTNADVAVVAYISTTSTCSTLDSSGNGISVFYKAISSGSWSTNQKYSNTLGTTSYTAPSGGTYVYICGYTHVTGIGGYTYSDFGSSGSTNGVTNFQITATY